MEPDGVVRWPVKPGFARGTVFRVKVTPGWIARGVLCAALRREAGSPLRVRVITDAVRSAFGLSAQDRLGLMLRGFDPACEFHLGEARPPDMPPVYNGHDGYRALREALDDAGAPEYGPEEVLDGGGPCFAVLVGTRFTGRYSGIMVPDRIVVINTFRDGLVVRQEIIWGWDSALEALAATVPAAA